LAPNKVIAEGYNLLTIERQNGEPVAGIITSETPTSVTVRDAGGQETVISRQNIQSMKEAGASAMPVGLESQISKQEMADLVEYLMSIQTVN
jgi:putative heme-binding domain-containing protein